MKLAQLGTGVRGGPDTLRFAWLLAALVMAFLTPPLLLAVGIGVASLRLGMVVVLVAALFAVSRHRRMRWVGVCLVSLTLVLDWVSLAVDSRALAIASGPPVIVFLLLVIGSMGRVLIEAEQVTTDTILGGICIYVLLGLLWVSAFTLLENAAPGSLLLAGEPLAERGAGGQEGSRYVEILYFSFITLTTLGYGDMIPTSPTGKVLAIGEAVVGQLYVAIFVARLVGLHLAQLRGAPGD